MKTFEIFKRREKEGLQRSIDANRKLLRSMESSRSNRLQRFGDHMPALLTAIEEAYKKGHFKHRPRGPLGKIRHLSTINNYTIVCLSVKIL